jgi:heat shock protein HspQ
MEKLKFKINDKVKHKIRNFVGKIKKIDSNRIIVEPNDKNIKNLYPFGISCDINDLEKTTYVETF